MGASTWLAAAAIIGSVTAHAVQQPLLTPQTNINNNNKKPLVDSEKLQASIQAEPLVARSEDLYKLAELSWHEFNRPTRVIGSAGHRATLDYIWSELAQLGNYYNVTEQTFAAYSGTVFEFRLVLADTVVPNATAFSLTPPTKDKQPVSGDLVLVAGNGCAAADYPVGLKGNVAFIRRGECPFGTKSALAGSAGALAAVVWNNEKGALHGTMGTPEKDHVATFGISLEEAEPYLKKLQAGEEVDAVAYMDAVVETIHTNNIVAQTLGGDQENCVMLGAHSDSVDAGPGERLVHVHWFAAVTNIGASL
jgi:aminopeptidase Y